FAVSSDLQVSSLEQINPVQRLPRRVLSSFLRVAVNPQIGMNKLEARQRARERIKLRAVADLAEKDLRMIGSKPEHAHRAARRSYQTGHQIHQRSLAGTIRPDQAGDARLDRESNTIHPEYLAVELRDVCEDDHVVIGFIR